MALTSFATGDSQTAKTWAKDLAHETLRASVAGLFIDNATSDHGTSLIAMKEELKRGKGDQVTVILDAQLTGTGRYGVQTLEGYEESVSTSTQACVINEQRHAVGYERGIAEQRFASTVDYRKWGRSALSDWFTDRVDTSIINQLTGNTLETNTYKLGFNTLTDFDTTYHRVLASTAATEQALNSTSFNITLDLIDKCVAKAETLNQADGTGFPIKPVQMWGQNVYVLIVHPNQARDLRTATGAGSLQDLTKYFFMGSEKDNPVVNGGFLKGQTKIVGVYNNTVILSNPRIPRGRNDSTGASVANTRRAVFCGAGALTMAFGGDSEFGRMDWSEEIQDYKKFLGIGSSLLYGCVRTRLGATATDFATIIVPTYSAD